MNNNKNEVQIRDIAIDICSAVEEFLEKYNITIPSNDRTGSDDEARLFGTEYYEFEDAVINVLKKSIEKQENTCYE